ncbi:hypothetical protein BS17DRAFT_770187 [Gyrodon lividus]|nr:hypothetical protein BS17DRAFT_770187 [Gyrodon lividus]
MSTKVQVQVKTQPTLSPTPSTQIQESQPNREWRWKVERGRGRSGEDQGCDMRNPVGPASTNAGTQEDSRTVDQNSHSISLALPSSEDDKHTKIIHQAGNKAATDILFKPGAWESANALFGSTQGAAISLGLESTVEEVYSTWSPQAMEGS